jgi:hypothetical protein
MTNKEGWLKDDRGKDRAVSPSAKKQQFAERESV